MYWHTTRVKFEWCILQYVKFLIFEERLLLEAFRSHIRYMFEVEYANVYRQWDTKFLPQEIQEINKMNEF